MSSLVIRIAKQEDARAILDIYEPYILNTAITFEYEKVPLEIFQERMSKVQEQFPWLVSEMNGKIVGYAYASPFKERAAFAWDCECSVYVDGTVHQKGVATALYTKLLELVEQQGYYNVYALITVPNEKSIALHKKFGFRDVGVFQKTGYKMGTWWDLCILEKKLRNFEGVPEGIKTISEVLNYI